MIKSTTTIFFILLANIMLLAEVVVPHHHHKCAVYIVKTHYTVNDNTNNHSLEVLHQKKGCKKECKYIALDQIIVFLSNPLKIEYKGFICPGNNLCYNAFKQALNNTQSYAFGSVIPSNAYPPTLIKSSYSHFLNTISGLRAPPEV